MAPNRKVSKKKAKKKKGTNKKDDWTFEGGQLLDSVAENSGIKRVGRRDTQERDERLRRSKQKRLDHKANDHFKRKMSQKVKFQDGSDAETLSLSSSAIEKREKKIRYPSSYSVLDRLQFFVGSNSKQQDAEIEAQEIVQHVVDGLDFRESSVLDDSQMVSDGSIVAFEDSFDAMVEEGAEELDLAGKSCYHWFFTSNTDTQNSDGIQIPKSEEIGGFEICGRFNAQNYYREIAKLGDIEGLHKLWRHRCSEQLGSKLQSALLSYLSCFPDILLEGRDYQMDHDILRIALTHICIHSVRSR